MNTLVVFSTTVRNALLEVYIAGKVDPQWVFCTWDDSMTKGLRPSAKETKFVSQFPRMLNCVNVKDTRRACRRKVLMERVITKIMYSTEIDMANFRLGMCTGLVVKGDVFLLEVTSIVES